MSAQVIVFGNEKGGAGKSTLAIHVVAALLGAGRRVAIIDLDLRQRSLGRFVENRAAWGSANGVELPLPLAPDMGDGAALAREDAGVQTARFEAALTEAVGGGAEFICIDTPGGDSDVSRLAHVHADRIVTPMNDSFVDFDMLGQVDPITLDVVRPSVYAETVWEARKRRAMAGGKPIDWVVLSNRLAVAAARNRQRLDERVAALARRVGFRVAPGLRDRVIYRELFPFGLTVGDLSPEVRPVAVSLAHVAARQELRVLMHALNLAERAAPEEAA